MVRLSVIIPTKNEPNAAKAINELAEKVSDAEIIVIDKSSKKERDKLKKTKAQVIEQEGTGYENALMQGFRIAKGELLASLDPDGTYSIDDFIKVVNELENENDKKVGFVSGGRTKVKKGAMTTSIKIGNRFLTGLFNLLYKSHMTDVLSGAFVMRREAFDSIRDEDAYRAGTLFFEIELVRHGYKVKNIDITYSERAGGNTSRITRFKPAYGLTIAYHAIRYARDYNPLLIFGSIGVIAIVLGIVLGAFVIANYMQTGTLNEVGRALIAFMLVISGLLSVIAGFILDLLLEIERKIYKSKL